jgi:hypothetical protein
MDAVTLDWTTTGSTAVLPGRALRMKALEDENARLRRLLVDALLAGPRQVAESEAEHWGQCGPQPDVGDALLLCNV